MKNNTENRPRFRRHFFSKFPTKFLDYFRIICYNAYLRGLIAPNCAQKRMFGGAELLSELKNSPRVVGVKQLRKALGRDEIRRVFLADDADPAVTEPIQALAEEGGVPVTRVRSMRELGQACGIAVGAAAAGLRKP